MRLIDADKLKKDLESITLSNGTLLNTNTVLLLLDKYPTTYDVDKVLEKLRTARDGYSTAQLMTSTNNELVKHFIAKEKAMNLSIEIVKRGGKNE